MKNAEHRRAPLLANLGDIHRPLRVRLVRYMNREWWAVDSADTWPGMVMDLRRLGFESVAVEDEVLVREATSLYEPELAGPLAPGGFKPFPTIMPTIKVRSESYFSGHGDLDGYEDYDMRYDEDNYTDEEVDVEDAYSNKNEETVENLD